MNPNPKTALYGGDLSRIDWALTRILEVADSLRRLREDLAPLVQPFPRAEQPAKPKRKTRRTRR